MCTHNHVCSLNIYVGRLAYTCPTHEHRQWGILEVASGACLPGSSLAPHCLLCGLGRVTPSYLICKLRITVTASHSIPGGSNELMCTVSLECNWHAVGA